MRVEMVKRTPLTAGTWRPRAAWRGGGWGALAPGVAARLGLGPSLPPPALPGGMGRTPVRRLAVRRGGYSDKYVYRRAGAPARPIRRATRRAARARRVGPGRRDRVPGVRPRRTAHRGRRGARRRGWQRS